MLSQLREGELELGVVAESQDAYVPLRIIQARDG